MASRSENERYFGLWGRKGRDLTEDDRNSRIPREQKPGPDGISAKDSH
jgi:hypothetical protein